jgi:hypothetical protein
MPKPNKKQLLKDEAIRLLASGEEILATANKIGVNKSTLHRWMAEGEFKRMLDAAKQKSLDASNAADADGLILKLEEQLKPLAASMLAIAKDKSASESTRISASAEYRNLVKHIRTLSLSQKSAGSPLATEKNKRNIVQFKGDPRKVLKIVNS